MGVLLGDFTSGSGSRVYDVAKLLHAVSISVSHILPLHHGSVMRIFVTKGVGSCFELWAQITCALLVMLFSV